jgi:glutaconate CoA-transferase subunit B
MSTVEFTDTEFMTCACARQFEDGKTVFVGFGMPQVAALLAERLYTPNVLQVFEFGAIGPRAQTPFVRGTMGGPTNTYRSLQWTSMNWAFAYAATGYIDYGVLGAAQVDPFGNINTTFLGGDYDHPKRRFPGSGGGNEVASLCWKTIILLSHEQRRFVETLDFCTSPGYLRGGRDREAAGLPRGTGPFKVVTSKALFGFDSASGRMRLDAVLRGLSADEVLGEMGFTPLLAPRVAVLEPPTPDELRVLRKEIDPAGMITGRGRKITVDIGSSAR